MCDPDGERFRGCFHRCMFRVVGIMIVLVTGLLVASAFALMGAGIVVPVVLLAALIWLVRVAGAADGH